MTTAQVDPTAEPAVPAPGTQVFLTRRLAHRRCSPEHMRGTVVSPLTRIPAGFPVQYVCPGYEVDYFDPETGQYHTARYFIVYEPLRHDLAQRSPFSRRDDYHKALLADMQPMDGDSQS